MYHKNIIQVLVRNPSILLLDEFTSALDPEATRLVENAIFKPSKTVDATVAVRAVAPGYGASSLANANGERDASGCVEGEGGSGCMDG